MPSSVTPAVGATASDAVGEITDKRLLRGARTRQAVLAHAVDMASLDNLEALSFGRLAAEVGLSKAGIQTLFRTKEALQLATIEHARRMFIDFVIRPANAKSPGVERFRELIERWIAYAEQPLFEGGCFQAANLAVYDSRPGVLRDKLAQYQQEWVDVLSAELACAVERGEIARLDTDLAAFQTDAVLRTANTSMRLGDQSVEGKIRRVVEHFLVPVDG